MPGPGPGKLVSALPAIPACGRSTEGAWLGLKILCVVVALLIFAARSYGSATNVYITQNGSPSGNCSTGVKDAVFFNTASNWGSSPTQIGPGTTVLLCGTFTFPAGATGLTVNGSGTASSPIVIQFDTNTVLQAPYFGGSNLAGICNSSCGGAIDVLKYSFIVLDGGTNGTIQNTANGTTLANQQASTGVYLNGSNFIARNLTIKNIYMNNGSSSSATDQGGTNTTDILVDNGSSNVTLCNNTLNNARLGILSDSSGTGGGGAISCASNSVSAGVNYFNNTLTDHAWQIKIGGSGSMNVYANDVGSETNWQFPISAYHTDGVIAFGDSSLITVYIYNNYFHGDLGQGSPTGQIFCTYGGPGSGSACTIFNNLIVGVGSGVTNDSLIYFHSAQAGNLLGPHQVYSNTLLYGNTEHTLDGDSTTLYSFQNNIVVGGAANQSSYAYGTQSFSQPFSTIVAINNNNYFNNKWNWGGVADSTLTSWQTDCTRGGGGGGCDSASIYQDPGLNASYQLQSGSPGIGRGTNLTSLCTGQLTALCYDKPAVVGAGGSTIGTRRPASGRWDAGAYQYVSSPPLLPPTGLTTTVR